MRMQYGFGDVIQLKQLDDILNGKAVLGIGNGNGEAQTVKENGQKTVYLNNYKDDMTREEMLTMGITLSHEAYRDGVVGTEIEQKAETRNAVKGHTELLSKMLDDNMYTKVMNGLVGNNKNLQIDLLAKSLGDDIFNSYIDGSYDSSADYWKLNKDGELEYDGKADLIDEAGYTIFKSTKSGAQGGLQELLGISVTEAVKLMKSAGLSLSYETYTDSEGKEKTVYWSNNPTDGSKKIGLSTTFTKDDGTSITFNDLYKSVKIKDYMTGQVGTLKDLNPKTIYDNMVANGTMDLRPGIENAPDSVLANIPKDGQYISYEQFREQNFMTNIISAGVNYETQDTFVEYEVSGMVGAKGNRSKNPHRGADGAVDKGTPVKNLFVNENSIVNSIFDSESDLLTAQGYHVDILTKLTYRFKGQQYNDEILTRYLHLSEISVKPNQSVNANTILGKTGNTGYWEGEYQEHSHEDISTKKQSPYLDYLTKNNSAVSNRIFYDNRYYYDKFLFADLSKYTVRSTAWTYDK